MVFIKHLKTQDFLSINSTSKNLPNGSTQTPVRRDKNFAQALFLVTKDREQPTCPVSGDELRVHTWSSMQPVKRVLSYEPRD